MFQWAAIWLGIGFALKWLGEFREKACKKIREWSEKMFDFVLVSASFALIWLVFGHLHLGWGSALLAFLFWGFVLAVFKID